MKNGVLILAAFVMAAFSTVSAQAGGTRLHFGGPLGSFVAKPYSGSVRYCKSSKNNRKALAAQKAAQRRAAARRLAAQKAAAHKAQEKKLAAQKAAARKAEAAQARIAKVEATKESTTDSDWNAPVKASAIAGTNTLEFKKNVEPVVDESGEANDVEKAGSADDTKEETEVAKLECKRFVPSAGLTISVPCGE
jgi:hypothetical protein